MLAGETARWCSRFDGTHEGAHELALDQRRDCVYVKALTCQELPRVLDAINSRGSM